MKRKIKEKFIKLCGGGYLDIDENHIDSYTPELNEYIKKTFQNMYITNKTINSDNKNVQKWYSNFDLYNDYRNKKSNKNYTIVLLIEDQLNSIGHFIMDPGFLFMYDLLLEEETTGSRFNSLASAIYTPTKSSINRLNLPLDDKIQLLCIYSTLLLYYFNPNILETEYKVKLINSVYDNIEMLIGNFKHIIYYLDQSRPKLKDNFIKLTLKNFLDKSEPYFKHSLTNKKNSSVNILFKKLGLI